MSIHKKIEDYTAKIAKINQVVINKEDPVMVLISVVGLLLSDLEKAQETMSNESQAVLQKLVSEFEVSMVNKTIDTSSQVVTKSVQVILNQIKDYIDNPKTADIYDLKNKISEIEESVFESQKAIKYGLVILGITSFVLVTASILVTVKYVFL